MVTGPGSTLPFPGLAPVPPNSVVQPAPPPPAPQAVPPSPPPAATNPPAPTDTNEVAFTGTNGRDRVQISQRAANAARTPGNAPGINTTPPNAPRPPVPGNTPGGQANARAIIDDNHRPGRGNARAIIDDNDRPGANQANQIGQNVNAIG